MSDYIIGLTGGIGSGKTTVANFFADIGIDIIDADVIARDVVKKGSTALASIANHFGAQYILPNGELHRALLRQKIFSNTQDKVWLNNLLHPLIREEISSQAIASTSPYCIIVVPLLIENGMIPLVDRVLVIDVQVSTQLTRTTARDNNTTKQVQAIIDSQISREERLANADDIINNDDSTLTTIADTVAILHQKYLTLAQQHKP